jgi:hypothetical protein
MVLFYRTRTSLSRPQSPRGLRSAVEEPRRGRPRLPYPHLAREDYELYLLVACLAPDEPSERERTDETLAAAIGPENARKARDVYRTVDSEDQQHYRKTGRHLHVVPDLVPSSEGLKHKPDLINQHIDQLARYFRHPPEESDARSADVVVLPPPASDEQER